MIKNKEYLITTSIDIKKKTNHKKVILGEWCISFDDKDILNDKSYILINYHWDNREKLKNDYKLINKIFEIYLDALTFELNKYHQSNYSKRYWRIILGPWLGQTLCILLDRWYSMNNAKNKFKNLYLIHSKNKLEEFIPINMGDWSKKNSNDKWNKYLFQIIAEEIDLNIEYEDRDTKIEQINCKNKKKVQKQITYLKNNILEIKKYIKKLIKRKLISIFSINRSKKNKIIFYNTYLNFLSTLKLLIQDKRIIIPEFEEYEIDKKFDFEFRYKKLICNYQKLQNFENEFICFCEKIIPLLIPKIFLENYREFVEINSNKSNKNIKAIMTSSGAYMDQFQIYTASLVEKGTKLFIFQHGGHYGLGQFSFYDDHEYLISDYFLSWGWTKKNKNKIIPFGALNFFHKSSIKRNIFRKKILLILNSLPKYAYNFYSVPISSNQVKSYHKDQFNFFNLLPKNISKNLEVRLAKDDYNYKLKSEWNKKAPNIKIIDSNIKIKNLYSNYRIFIGTYNATNFLELLFYNIPSIIFWNPKHSETNIRSKEFFQLLKESNIFHESPESAALFLTKIYNDIDQWWYSNKTQNARNIFCNQYAFVPKNPINKISNLVF